MVDLDRTDDAMLSVVSKMPEMIEQAEGFSAGVNLPKLKKISQVVILGMGGSAIAGDIAADLFLKRAKAPILTVRNYVLPEFVGPGSLVFALSYSGDTEEVITAVKEAEKRGAAVICITSGGKLREIALAKKYPLYLIPTGYQPRAALPYLLIPLLISFQKLGIIPSISDEIREAIVLLLKLRDEYGARKPARSNPAKQFAKKIAGTLPLIFGSAGTTGAAALRFKTQLNENGKATAHLSLFPELNHNEIVNLAALKREAHKFSWVIFRDDADSERIKKRIEVTKSLIGRQVGAANEIVSQGKSSLARIFSLILFTDFVSVYVALLQGIDPTPVEIISRLKKEMLR